MSNSEYELRECALRAAKTFGRNMDIVLLTVAVLPLPGYLMWTDAPMPILCAELTLLDCFYLTAAVLVIYGMFGSIGEKISVRQLVSPFLRPVEVLVRCWQFFYSNYPGFWKSIWLMVLGIVFGLGAQWLAGPWKLPPEQNLIGACVYTAFLLIFSQDLVGWMLAPYYLANLKQTANEAYACSHFFDTEGKHWDLRLTAVACLLVPVLSFGLIRYAFLKPADFVDYQLNFLLTYVLSIAPWMLSMYSLFLWNEIYKQRIGLFRFEERLEKGSETRAETDSET